MFSKSSESLIKDFDSVLSTEDDDPDKTKENDVKIVQEVVKVDVHSPSVSKSYILDKINDKNSINSDNISNSTFVKPPVPKPRKLKQNKQDKNDIELLPTQRKNKERETDNLSNETYKISLVDNNGKINNVKVELDKENTEDNISNKTYSVEFDNDIDKNDQSSTSSKISNDSSKTFIVEDNDKNLNDKSEIYNKKDNIEYIDEKTNKTKKRSDKNKNDNLEENNNESIQIENNFFNLKSKISIIIHETDKLLLDSLVVHPIIKIHIVNIENGEYVKYKSNKKEENCHINPIMTHAFNLQEHRSFVPKWQETILINENLNTLIDNDDKTLFLFELIDFLTFSTLSRKLDNDKLKTGLHRIAWAFLKINKNNADLIVNKKIRLQLYQPRKVVKIVPSSHCEIFNWFQKNKLKKYPSTLYVTLKEKEPNDREVDTLRSSVKMLRKKILKDFINGELIFNNDDFINKNKICDGNKLDTVDSMPFSKQDEQEYVTKMLEDAKIKSKKIAESTQNNSKLIRNNSVHFKQILDKIDCILPN